MSFKSYLHCLFDESESVWVADNLRSKYKSLPVKYVEKVLVGKSKFIVLHAAKGPNLGRSGTNEANLYRNLLIEMDDPKITPDEQMDIIAALGLPYSTATYSGGKSVHFVIALGIPVSWDEYKRLANRLMQIIPTMDKNVATRGRFTRLPKAFRDGVEQKLLAVKGRVPNQVLEDFFNRDGIRHLWTDTMSNRTRPSTALIPIANVRAAKQFKRNKDKIWIKHLLQKYLYRLGHDAVKPPFKVPCPVCRASGKDTDGDHLCIDGDDLIFKCFAGHTGKEVIAALQANRRS